MALSTTSSAARGTGRAVSTGSPRCRRGPARPPARHTREAEAFLLPVLGLVDARADDLLHQVLRVGAVDAVRVLHRAVGHGGRRSARSAPLP